MAGRRSMNSSARLAFRLAFLLAAAWLALAAIPAAAGLFDDDVARKQVVDLQQRLDAANSRQEEAAARLIKLEESVKAQATNQAVLDLANQLQVMREELRGLRGQIEVLANNIEGNSKRQRDMYVDLDTRLRRFEGSPASPAAGAALTPGASAGSGPAAEAVVGDENKAYEAAQTLRRNGNYQAAIVAFQSFILQYPKSSLAHRAQYWIGDSYYNLRDFRNAITSQQRVLSTYPNSASAPDALLNLASAQIELGDGSAAKKTMNSLVARYPTSDAAEKAKRRLATLR